MNDVERAQPVFDDSAIEDRIDCTPPTALLAVHTARSHTYRTYETHAYNRAIVARRYRCDDDQRAIIGWQKSEEIHPHLTIDICSIRMHDDARTHALRTLVCDLVLTVYLACGVRWSGVRR